MWLLKQKGESVDNLAGRYDCDVFIKKELERCGIESTPLPGKLQTEVPAAIMGKLGRFEFYRAWCYWIVCGPVPLNVAKELYADPVGKTDIRVSGHCGCPPPDKPWITWRSKSGKILADIAQREVATESFGEIAGFIEDLDKKYEFVDNPTVVGEGFIETYHIDSELGLRVFADTLRKYNLV